MKSFGYQILKFLLIIAALNYLINLKEETQFNLIAFNNKYKLKLMKNLMKFQKMLIKNI
jgi:hypothetical protein